MVPDSDGDIIGEKMAFTGIRMVDLACRRLRGKASEDISRGEMEMVPSTAEQLAESSFAGSWGAEEQNGTVGSAFA